MPILALSLLDLQQSMEKDGNSLHWDANAYNVATKNMIGDKATVSFLHFTWLDSCCPMDMAPKNIQLVGEKMENHEASSMLWQQLSKSDKHQNN